MNRKHMLLMVLVCGLPLAALLFLPLSGAGAGGGTAEGSGFGGWTVLLILLCPLMHLFMMRGGHGHHHGHGTQEDRSDDRQPAGEKAAGPSAGAVPAEDPLGSWVRSVKRAFSTRKG